MTLTSTAKAEAIRLARWAFQRYVKGSELEPPILTDPLFEELRGVFITLHKEGELRGCVGRVDPLMALKDEIPNLTLAAAMHDPRFLPISSQEVDGLDIEISVLDAPEKVEDMKRIRVGVHGVIVEKGEAKGLILPQVALQEGWDRDTFLSQACVKARLPEDAWQDPATTILRFTAHVFSR